MNHDDVALTADEEATFLALARSFGEEHPSRYDPAAPPGRTASILRPVVASVGFLLLVVGGLIAATTAGHFSQGGTVAWSLGTVTTLWAVVTGQPALSWGSWPATAAGRGRG